MTTEIWKDIKGYEDRYQVSNLGRVKSLPHERTTPTGGAYLTKPRILKPSSNGKGYMRLTLRKDNKEVSKYVHRLVAEAFIPNLDNLPEVNHKDEVKNNNKVNNLEWCTPKYNNNYGTLPKRISKRSSKKVYVIYPDGKEVLYNSLKEAGEAIGGLGTKISACIRGRDRMKTYKGCTFRYYDEGPHKGLQ